jgi:hypothetical protein
MTPHAGFQSASPVSTDLHTVDRSAEVKLCSKLVKFCWCIENTGLLLLISCKAATLQPKASVYIINTGNWKL